MKMDTLSTNVLLHLMIHRLSCIEHELEHLAIWENGYKMYNTTLTYVTLHRIVTVLWSSSICGTTDISTSIRWLKVVYIQMRIWCSTTGIFSITVHYIKCSQLIITESCPSNSSCCRCSGYSTCNLLVCSLNHISRIRGNINRQQTCKPIKWSIITVMLYCFAIFVHTLYLYYVYILLFNTIQSWSGKMFSI